MHKTFKTFLFFTRKKKQKNLTSATSAKGGFALVARLKKTRDRSYFSKRCAEKSPHKTFVFFFLSVMFFLPKADLRKIKISSPSGFQDKRKKPLKLTKNRKIFSLSFFFFIKN